MLKAHTRQQLFVLWFIFILWIHVLSSSSKVFEALSFMSKTLKILLIAGKAIAYGWIILVGYSIFSELLFLTKLFLKAVFIYPHSLIEKIYLFFVYGKTYYAMIAIVLAFITPAKRWLKACKHVKKLNIV